MALIKCEECKKEISDDAKVCPQCGAKPSKKTSILTWIIGVIFLVVFSKACTTINENTEATKQNPVNTSNSSLTEASPPSWEYSTQDDKMTSKSQSFAIVKSVNSMSLEFPYTGRNFGTLTVRTSAKGGADVLFSFEKGQSMCLSYKYSCPVIVRFDDKEPIKFMGIGPSDNSTEAAFLNNTTQFITEAKKAKTIKVSMEIYKNGTQILEFGPLTPLTWPKK